MKTDKTKLLQDIEVMKEKLAIERNANVTVIMGNAVPLVNTTK